MIAQAVTHLNQDHVEHLISEGFSSSDLTQMQRWGVHSLTEEESKKKRFQVKGADGNYQSSSGLYFPFTDTFGQLRADTPPLNSKGKPCKYLTPAGAKSEAWLPHGCKVVTEGFKDAAAGTLRGDIPTGALAGVSHYRKALKEGAEYTIVFDADGWENPAVFRQLVQAGLYLKGRIQLIPPIEGEPKAGLCEYFKAGHTAEDYKALIASAMKPKEFMLALPDHWGELSEIKQSECARELLTLAAKYLPDMERQCLISKLRRVTGIPINTLRSHLNRALLKETLKAERAQRQAEPERPKQQGLIPISYHPETGEPILPNASFVANILADHYRPILAFNIEQQEFYRYGSEFKGQWSLEPVQFVRNMIGTELNASGVGDVYSSGYIASVCDLLRDQLAVRR